MRNLSRFIAGLSLFALTSIVQATSFSQLVVFGDSLSDSGNVSFLSGGAIPGSPYFNGRFSNGPNYADVLASNLGLPLTPSLFGGTNYAYGGARTDSQPFGAQFSTESQVGAYVGGGLVDSSALYIVYVGGNNLSDAIVAVAMNPANAAAIATAAISNAVGDITNSIIALAQAGATNIIVPNAPNLGLTPRFSELGSAAIVAFATDLSIGFNSALAASLANVSGTNLIQVDVFGALQNLVDNPSAFGLTNVTERCYTGDDQNFTGGGSLCANPDQYLFFDGFHPTAAVHRTLAAAVSNAIPEPNTTLLLVLGLLMLTVAVQRRLKKA